MTPAVRKWMGLDIEATSPRPARSYELY